MTAASFDVLPLPDCGVAAAAAVPCRRRGSAAAGRQLCSCRKSGAAAAAFLGPLVNDTPLAEGDMCETGSAAMAGCKQSRAASLL